MRDYNFYCFFAVIFPKNVCKKKKNVLKYLQVSSLIGVSPTFPGLTPNFLFFGGIQKLNATNTATPTAKPHGHAKDPRASRFDARRIFRHIEVGRNFFYADRAAYRHARLFVYGGERSDPGRAARLRRNLHAVDYFRFETDFSHAAARVSVYAMQKRRRNDMAGVPDFRSRRRRRIVRVSAAPHTQTNKQKCSKRPRTMRKIMRPIYNLSAASSFSSCSAKLSRRFLSVSESFLYISSTRFAPPAAFFFFAPYAFFSLSEASSRSLPFKR